MSMPLRIASPSENNNPPTPVKPTRAASTDNKSAKKSNGVPEKKVALEPSTKRPHTSRMQSIPASTKSSTQQDALGKYYNTAQKLERGKKLGKDPSPNCVNLYKTFLGERDGVGQSRQKNVISPGATVSAMESATIAKEQRPSDAAGINKQISMSVYSSKSGTQLRKSSQQGVNHVKILIPNANMTALISPRTGIYCSVIEELPKDDKVQNAKLYDKLRKITGGAICSANKGKLQASSAEQLEMIKQRVNRIMQFFVKRDRTLAAENKRLKAELEKARLVLSQHNLNIS